MTKRKVIPLGNTSYTVNGDTKVSQREINLNSLWDSEYYIKNYRSTIAHMSNNH